MTELETDELLTLLTHANNEIDRLITERDEWEQIAADLQFVITTLDDQVVELKDKLTHIEKARSIEVDQKKLLEEKLAEVHVVEPNIVAEHTLFKEQIQLLEEKLSLCDRYYKIAVDRLAKIQELANQPMGRQP